MPYLILAHDHEGMEAKREEVREAHRKHLAAQGRKLLASGALLAVDGKIVVGGASLIDTDNIKKPLASRPKIPMPRQVSAHELKSWNGD